MVVWIPDYHLNTGHLNTGQEKNLIFRCFRHSDPSVIQIPNVQFSFLRMLWLVVISTLIQFQWYSLILFLIACNHIFYLTSRYPQFFKNLVQFYKIRRKHVNVIKCTSLPCHVAHHRFEVFSSYWLWITAAEKEKSTETWLQ